MKKITQFLSVLTLAGLLFGGILHAQSLKLTGWPYEVDVVKSNLVEFKKQTGINAVFEPYPSDNYRDKMIINFTAGTEFDVVYVRDNFLAEWAAAGWIVPIDGMPGVDKRLKDFSKATLEQISYKGKVYGLPYYSGLLTMMYNKAHLKKAGIANPPKTWNELLKVAKILKDKKISKKPIILQMKQGPNYFLVSIETITAGFGGSMFDSNMEPVLQKKGGPFINAMAWLKKGLDAGLIDRASLNSDDHDVVNVMSSGAATFTITADYNAKTMNDPEKSKVAGDISIALIPGNGKVRSGTTAYIRFYAITKDSKNKKAAWELLKFLGSTDKKGEYFVAKRWALEFGLGFSQLALYKDKDIRESLSKWTSPDVLAEQSNYIVNRPYRFVPFFSDWESEFQGDFHELLSEDDMDDRQEKLEEIAETWNDLKSY